MRLDELLAGRKKILKASYRSLITKAEAAGYAISLTRLRELTLNQPEMVNVPGTDTIMALAAAFELDPDEILDACAESVGITRKAITLSHGNRAWLMLTADRTDAEIETLIEVARTVADAIDRPPLD